MDLEDQLLESGFDKVNAANIAITLLDDFMLNMSDLKKLSNALMVYTQDID